LYVVEVVKHVEAGTAQRIIRKNGTLENAIENNRESRAVLRLKIHMLSHARTLQTTDDNEGRAKQ
jgi:hypothetical protein